MAFDSQAVINLFLAMRSQASSSGLFDRVIGHEPKNAPGNRLSYSIRLGPIAPVPGASGLAATAGRVVIEGRIQVPQSFGDSAAEDKIETAMTHAIVGIIGQYSKSITVGGTVMEIDLLGMYGVPLAASNVGYVEQDGTHYRVADITIPVIIDALWTQVD